MPERKIEFVYFTDKDGVLHHRDEKVDLEAEDAKRYDDLLEATRERNAPPVGVAIPEGQPQQPKKAKGEAK